MKNYEQEIEMYFELKGSPDSSRESYRRRIKALKRKQFRTHPNGLLIMD